MVKELVASEVREHLQQFVPARPPELQGMEEYARQHHFPIIGPVAGHFCYQIARMIGARQVFELGSGYGYSTAWFARAVRENGGGTVHHVVWDEGLSSRARQHLAALGFDDLVQYHVGEAVQALRATAGAFDLIFNDIDKEAYPAALPVIHEKLRPGGVLIVDNLLWSGRIFDPEDQSPDTRGVRELTQLMREDQGWIASIIPIRDGLLVAHRK
jgi:predicted O-methyltransferase YrrM